MENLLGTIDIFIKDRHSLSAPVNAILNDNSRLVMSRLGVNVEPQCTGQCSAIICLAVSGPSSELEELRSVLEKLDGVSAKLNLME